MTRTKELSVYEQLSRLFGGLISAVSALVLLGWNLDNDVLKSVWPGLTPMNPFTAGCLIFCGLSLILIVERRLMDAALALALFSVGVGFLKVLSYAFHWGLVFDQLLFSDRLFGNQIPPNTAGALLLAGSSMALLHQDRPRPAQLFAFLTLLVGWSALLGYFYRSQSLYQISDYTPMAAHTAVIFILLSVGLLFARPYDGYMRMLTSATTIGSLLRILLPVIFVLPSVVGWLRLLGEDIGYFDKAFGVAAFVIVSIALFTIVVWKLSASIYQTEVTRKENEEKVRQKVQEAMELKSEFISTVSHELRTPLSVIKESVSLVEDGTAGEVNNDQRDFLRTAKRNVERLARLINNVLDYQKLDAGRMEMKAAVNDLAALSREVGKGFELLAAGKSIEMRYELDPAVPPFLFDKDMFSQVLTNYLNNAFKFTEKGIVKIRTQRMNGSVRVSVVDSGCGIKPEDLHKLFKSFSQITEGKDRKTGGTGLGLAICKKIVGLHGGEVGVESQVGQGSTFFFTVPIRQG